MKNTEVYLDTAKSAKIVCNLRKFLLNPQVFEKPNLFNPDRFISEDRTLIKYEQMVPFDIGRKVCMGGLAGQKQLVHLLDNDATGTGIRDRSGSAQTRSYIYHNADDPYSPAI